MTTTATAPPGTTALRERFAPVLDDLARAAATHERERRHPFDATDRLRAAGFGALRVPAALGGHGASMRQLFTLLVDLAAAESNLAQALRQHLFRVELLLLDPDRNAEALRAVARGDLYGNATTEPRDAVLGHVATRLSVDADGRRRLDGTKIYSTGNLYAQHIPVSAVDEEDRPVVVTVPADRPGVEVRDDWTGFGQRLTGSGTTVFTGVEVDPVEVEPAFPGSHLGGGFHQLVLLATLAGIAEAAGRDATDLVRARRRVYYTGTGALPKDDPVVQTALGEVLASARIARTVVEDLGAGLGDAWRTWAAGGPAERVERAFVDHSFAVDAAQVVLVPLVLDATTAIFDTLGASATEERHALDRHWRNARTVASHNPHLFKARVLGDHALNGTVPPGFAAGHDVGVKPGS